MAFYCLLLPVIKNSIMVVVTSILPRRYIQSMFLCRIEEKLSYNDHQNTVHHIYLSGSIDCIKHCNVKPIPLFLARLDEVQKELLYYLQRRFQRWRWHGRRR